MEDIINTVRFALKNSIDEKTRLTSQKFFKEKIKYYGVRMPTVNRISMEQFKLIESKTKLEIFNFCESLWNSGYIE